MENLFDIPALLLLRYSGEGSLIELWICCAFHGDFESETSRTFSTMAGKERKERKKENE